MTVGAKTGVHVIGVIITNSRPSGCFARSRVLGSFGVFRNHIKVIARKGTGPISSPSLLSDAAAGTCSILLWIFALQSMHTFKWESCALLLQWMLFFSQGKVATTSLQATHWICFYLPPLLLSQLLPSALQVPWGLIWGTNFKLQLLQAEIPTQTKPRVPQEQPGLPKHEISIRWELPIQSICHIIYLALSVEQAQISREHILVHLGGSTVFSSHFQLTWVSVCTGRDGAALLSSRRQRAVLLCGVSESIGQLQVTLTCSSMLVIAETT